MSTMDEHDRYPPPDDPLMDEREEGSFAGRVIPDLFKRALMTGIGTVFMTEEGIKNALGDLKMPKEAYGYVVGQADRTKRELIATIARELRGFLDNLELDELMRRSLEDTTFEINTTITIRRADDGEPKVEVGERSTKVTKKKSSSSSSSSSTSDEKKTSKKSTRDDASDASRTTRKKKTSKKSSKKKKSDDDDG